MVGLRIARPPCFTPRKRNWWNLSSRGIGTQDSGDEFLAEGMFDQCEFQSNIGHNARDVLTLGSKAAHKARVCQVGELADDGCFDSKDPVCNEGLEPLLLFCRGANESANIPLLATEVDGKLGFEEGMLCCSLSRMGADDPDFAGEGK